MKKLIKNKFLTLTIIVIFVSFLYITIQNAIDNYSFKANKEITVEEGNTKENKGHVIAVNEGEEISTEELDVVLEEEVENEESSSDLSEEIVEEEQRNNDFNEKSKIFVYITGEVNNPGVILLDEGSRIVDAINAAGGTTAKANITKVNLVYVLDDGMKVNIPNNNDLNENANFEYITMSSGEGGNDNKISSSQERVDSEGASTDNSKKGKKYSLVNINTATQTELETLPGIGPSLALNIINYRKENGKFTSIDDIKNVKGIGESKFENIKNYIIT